MWKLLFDSDFNRGFLTSEVMKGADVQEESWQKSADGGGGGMSKTTRYTKWLGMPIGPKTTKAILTDVCEHKDFDDYVSAVTTTSTPDVPSGSCFTTKVRTCITWAGPNQVQVMVTGAAEFSKSSWIKGQIEKGVAEGLTVHYKELNKHIRKHIAAHPKGFGGVAASVGGGKAANGSGAPSADRRRERSNGISVPSSGGVHNPGQRSKESIVTVPPVTGTSPSPATGVWSVFATEWNHSAVSHLALVSVLVAVMLANIYIFRQIASVSTQIERIQNGIFPTDPPQQHRYSGQYYDHDYDHQGRSSSPYARYPSAGSGRMSSGGMRYSREMDDYEREEMFARDQEDAMWTWLLEREARHRQYRAAASGVPPSKRHSAAPQEEPHWNDKNTRDRILQQQEQRAMEAETRLQSRIVELQARLAALEQQAFVIKMETRMVEQEQEQGVPTSEEGKEEVAV